MIPLYDIDIERVKLVREGKLTDRGCGKTTEKMVTLLSYLQPKNHGNQYLFVGENQNHVQDIYRTFFYWINDYGAPSQYSPSKLSYSAILPPPPKPATIVGKIIAFFSKTKPLPVITYKFTTAEMVNTRGLRYDRIILDLTPRTYYKNQERVEKAMWAECR